MKKIVISLVILFSFFFLTPEKALAASRCSLDTFNGAKTYCSLSCGGNSGTTGFTGCGFGQTCCAETSTNCEGNCAYGRKTYCSINGGGNPGAPAEFQDCGLGRSCFLGSPDSSCPAEPMPAGVCGAPDRQTGTTTFCSAICGYGSQASSNSNSTCSLAGNNCCRVSEDRCGGCQAGRREVCMVSDPSAGYAIVAKSCPAGSQCYLADYDATCPAPTGTTATYCNVSPFNYNGQLHKTYCGVGCGGNLVIDFPGCGGVAKQCCVSPDAFTGVPPASFFDQETNVSPYDLCKQLRADTEAFSKCTTCFGQRGVWTAVGCIKSDASSIVKEVMSLGLGIAGGVTLLVIMGAGFLLTISQNDPKRTTQAKEMLTAAVTGLLFIIFSVTILQFIGVTIIQIPGFGS